MPPRFHKLLFLFFKHCYKRKQILASWKSSLTILLYKKGDPSQLINHIPIALANTIYLFYTSTLTSIFSTCGERYQILHDNQEGFIAERGTSRQLQLLICSTWRRKIYEPKYLYPLHRLKKIVSTPLTMQDF